MKNKPANSNFRLGYRSDIEGLRAIAILLVIASHADITWLEGGFIGVDIFFVLSGYLITGLLLQETQANGYINFMAFYARRLKRLLPALLFMVVVISFVASILLAPFEHPQQAISAGYALLWVSNIYFAFSNRGYFEQSTDDSLFLHTWSLGVEEQFYLIWPILIVFFLGLWKWQGRKYDLNRLFLAMLGTIFICLLFSLFLSHTKPLWAFYLMPSRAWQFALGALALLWSTNKGHSRINLSFSTLTLKKARFLNIGGWFGFIIILGTALSIDSNMTYPGFLAILPSVGTVLILIAGAGGKSISLCKFISIKPLQWIGRISYSWYLWHWPILVLGGTIYHYSGFLQNWILVVISLLLAIISFFFVESPIRKNKAYSLKPMITIAGSIALMATTFAFANFWQYSSNTWAVETEQRIFQTIRADSPVLYSMGCDEWYHSADVRVCAFGSPEAEHTAVLFGDSIGAQWFPAIANIYQDNWKLLVITKSSCPIVDEPFFYTRIGRDYKECSIWRDAAIDWISDNKPDVVFMGTTRVNFNQEQWIKGTTRILERLTTEVDNIFIIAPTQSLLFDGPACLSRQQWQPDWLPVKSDCSSPAGSRLEKNIYQWLLAATSDFEHAHVINMNAIICPQGRCNAAYKDKIVYRDQQHLTSSYVRTLAGDFLREIRKSVLYHQ